MRVSVLGCGAIGGTVARALRDGRGADSVTTPWRRRAGQRHEHRSVLPATAALATSPMNCFGPTGRYSMTGCPAPLYSTYRMDLPSNATSSGERDLTCNVATCRRP